MTARLQPRVGSWRLGALLPPSASASLVRSRARGTPSLSLPPSCPKGTELLSPAALVCLANFLYGQKEAGEEDVLQLPRVPFGDCADAPRCEPT